MEIWDGVDSVLYTKTSTLYQHLDIFIDSICSLQAIIYLSVLLLSFWVGKVKCW